MNKEFRQRKPLHLKNFDYKGSGFVYFLTLCTAKKEPFFQNDELAKIIAEELDYRSAAGEINLFCWCVMPDHLHLLLSLAKQYTGSLQSWVSAFKRYTSRTARELFGIKPLWQKNFYEHIIRKEESLLEFSGYILNNPVRKGLVSDWSQYPFCKVVDEFFLQ